MEKNTLYLVYGNTYADIYGEYVSTFGVFTTLEKAEEVKTNKEKEYKNALIRRDKIMNEWKNGDIEKTFVGLKPDDIEFYIKEIKVDEVIDFELGGYAE